MNKALEIRERMNASSKKKAERLVGLGSLIILTVSWIIGFGLNGLDMEQLTRELKPEGTSTQKVSDSLFTLTSLENGKGPSGYIGFSTSNGFGGPLVTATRVGPRGSIQDIRIVSHKETASWMKEIEQSGLTDIIKKKNVRDNFTIGQDIDAVTGATYTSRAVILSVKDTLREVSLHSPDFPEKPEKSYPVQFGSLELTILVLLIATVLFQKTLSKKKLLQWIVMLVGLGAIGIAYNHSMTIVYINKLIMGYFPRWETSIYFYVLTLGFLAVLLVTGKNPYCRWICPFGTSQVIVNRIGGASMGNTGKYHSILIWTKRIIVLLSISLALIFQNPSIGNFELFGTAFGLIGSNRQFFLLTVVFLVALVMKRPWCTYLCPVGAVVNYIRMMRSWGKEIWNQKIVQKT